MATSRLPPTLAGPLSSILISHRTLLAGPYRMDGPLLKPWRCTPGSRVVFEFGNEPDLYPSENILGNPTADGEKSIRPGTYSWNDLVEEWRSYILAFQRDPITHAIPLVGPAYDSSNDWINLALGAFLDGVGTRNLAMATVHEYPTGTCSPEKAAEVSIPNMLSQRYIESYVYQVLTND